MKRSVSLSGATDVHTARCFSTKSRGDGWSNGKRASSLVKPGIRERILRVGGWRSVWFNIFGRQATFTGASLTTGKPTNRRNPSKRRIVVVFFLWRCRQATPLQSSLFWTLLLSVSLYTRVYYVHMCIYIIYISVCVCVCVCIYGISTRYCTKHLPSKSNCRILCGVDVGMLFTANERHGRRRCVCCADARAPRSKANDRKLRCAFNVQP